MNDYLKANGIELEDLKNDKVKLKILITKLKETYNISYDKISKLIKIDKYKIIRTYKK